MKRTILIISCSLAALTAARADVIADRINTAIPLPRAAQLSWMALKSTAAKPRERRELEQEFHMHMEIRALTCAPLVLPSQSATNQEIADRLGGSECIEKANAALAAWLGSRRVEQLLRMPPLRPPVRAVPPDISGLYPQVVDFAPRAGVGLVWGNNNLEIIELQNGRAIYRSEGTRPGSPIQFSPNGRLLLFAQPPGVGVMDAETGETITTLFSRVNEIYWLDDRTAMYVDASNRGTMLVDFHTGTLRKLNFLQASIQNVTALPQQPGVFIAFSGQSAMLLKVDSTGAEPQIRLLSEKPFHFQNSFRYPGKLSSDGRYYVSVSGNIAITSTNTLETEVIELSPFSVSMATALPKGDEFLLSGALPGTNNGFDHLVYSIPNHTLALVDRERLTATWLIYVPAAQAIACVTNGRITFVNQLPLRTPVPVADYIVQAQGDSRARAK